MNKGQLHLVMQLCSFAVVLLCSYVPSSIGIMGQDFIIARLKYQGGGDWYNDPEAEINLMTELKKRAGIETREEKKSLSLLDGEIYNYPFLFITGHGNVQFSQEEALSLRKFLISGGFLYADDDYGMNESFRREIKKVFPDKELVELPFNFPIYHCFYDFKSGLPKIHEHYPGPPKGYGIFHEGRLILFYTYNSNISDGWTPVHNDSPEKREEAFKMGVNIVWFALTQ